MILCPIESLVNIMLILKIKTFSLRLNFVFHVYFGISRFSEHFNRKSLYSVLKRCFKKEIDEKFKFLEEHIGNIIKYPEHEENLVKTHYTDSN